MISMRKRHANNQCRYRYPRKKRRITRRLFDRLERRWWPELRGHRCQLCSQRRLAVIAYLPWRVYQHRYSWERHARLRADNQAMTYCLTCLAKQAAWRKLLRQH